MNFVLGGFSPELSDEGPSWISPYLRQRLNNRKGFACGICQALSLTHLPIIRVRDEVRSTDIFLDTQAFSLPLGSSLGFVSALRRSPVGSFARRAFLARHLHTRATRFREPDRNRLLAVLNRMFSCFLMMQFFAYELTRLRRWRFTFLLRFTGALFRLFFRHRPPLG